MKKRILILYIVICCLCLLSCRDNNNAPIQAVSPLSEMEDQSSLDDLYEEYIYPDEWNENLNTTAGICKIDSKISIINDAYPIYRVSQDLFVRENLQNVLDYLNVAYELRNIDIPFKEKIILPNNEEATINLYYNYLSVQLKEYGVIQLEDWVIAGNAFPGEPAGKRLENVKISEEDAVSYGDSMLAALNIEHMALASITKARVIGEHNNTITEGWYLSYALNIGEYIPIDLSRISMPGNMNFEVGEYCAPWSRHELQLFVDEDGIQFFKWKNRLKIEGVIADNIDLLPFSEIQEVARHYIQQGYLGQPMLSEQDLPTVTQIILTNCLVQDNTNSAYGILMPTWVFYFHTPFYESNYLNPFALFINAIDGNRMDPLSKKQDKVNNSEVYA